MSGEAAANTRARMRKTKSTNKGVAGGKPIPQRTCIACRQVKSKRDLIRIVRTPEGKIEIDISGRKKGRGAYICPTRECMDKAFRGNQLERTLKTGITIENRDKLTGDLKNLSEGAE